MVNFVGYLIDSKMESWAELEFHHLHAVES